jgi:hypothetical protein
MHHLEQLAGDSIVWLITPDSYFLNGRFVHANWDVDELKPKKDKILKNPKIYTICLISW